MFLTACGSTAVRDQPRQYLDSQTAATITIIDKPLVFARERPELAANVRDYATVAVAAVNRSGKVSYFLFTYLWSTVDTRAALNQSLVGKSLVLAADDRLISLQTAGLTAHDAGMGFSPHHPNGVPAVELVAATDLATLRYLALARRLCVRFTDDATENPYERWKDQRASLRAFVLQLGGAQ